MKIRPLHDRVIIKREDEERTTAGGIVIPDSATEKPIRGKVMAVGNGKVLDNGESRKLDVKKGDKVLFGKYSGTEVKVEGEDLLVMREEDIMPRSSTGKGASRRCARSTGSGWAIHFPPHDLQLLSDI